MKKENLRLILTGLVSVVLGIVVETILVLSNISFLAIDRAIVVSVLVFLVGIHFTLDKIKLYEFITKHRYKIAIIVFMVTVILGISFVSFDEDSIILGKYNSYNHSGYVDFTNYFNIENEKFAEFCYLSFTNFKMIMSALAAYELIYIITNKNNILSAVGSFVIAFSSYMLTEMNMAIIFGQYALVFIHKLMSEKKEHKKEKIQYGILFVLSMILFGFGFELETVVAFGYVMLALFISFIILLKKDKVIEKKEIIQAVILFVSMFIIIGIYHVCMVNFGFENIVTEDNSINAVSRIMGYGVSVIETFKPVENPELWTNFISVFPMPILLALLYMYKKEDEFEFLFPISIVMVLEIVASTVGMPGILNTILGFSLVTKGTLAAMVGLMNVYIMFYIVTHLKERTVSFMASAYIPLILIAVYFFIARPIEHISRQIYYWYIVVIILPSLVISNYTDVRYRRILSYCLVILTLLAGVTINPISKAKYLDFTNYNEKNHEYRITKDMN